MRAGNDDPDPPLDLPDVLAGEYLAHAPQQDRSRRAREALIAAALARFAEHGYDATTVDDIAKQAGVAVGGFYLHFRSKRQVLLVLVDRLLREFGAFLQTMRDAQRTAPIECIRDGFRASWSYGGVYRAWREATLRDSTLARLHEQVEEWAAGKVAAALSTAAKAPGARANIDVAMLARVLSTIFWRQLEVPTADRGTLPQTVVAVIRHTLFEDGASGAGEPVSVD